MDSTYKTAMLEQLELMQSELAEMYEILNEKNYFNRLEMRAAERLMQMLVECCIGIAKQKLKSLGQPNSGEARANFNRLIELGMTSADIPWSKIIGMRNALVHDYLNIEPERLLNVIRTQQYKALFEFCEEMLA